MDRRTTTTDVVFDQLYEEIISLTLLPGTKLSEADVARRFGVSRQPVRDAFNRLENLELVLIRPQKATKVRGFSLERIDHARFVRMAVELEVVRRACAIWDNERAAILEQNLDQQRKALAADTPDDFHALDYAFHNLICEHGGCPLTIETIRECKQKVDRLCTLSLGREREASILYEDHCKIAEALKNRSEDEAVAIAREHLGRLDETILEIRRNHAEYFE